MLRIIDTETCGLQGGIVEIASVDVIDGKIVTPMSHLVRPDRPISPQAMAIHRITEAMVADKPWIEDVIPHYYGSEWYVAHNASFDRRVAYRYYEHLRLDGRTDGRYHRTSVVDDDLHLWQIPWQSGFRRCRTRSGLSALVI